MMEARTFLSAETMSSPCWYENYVGIIKSTSSIKRYRAARFHPRLLPLSLSQPPIVPQLSIPWRFLINATSKGPYLS